jgi:ribosomal protein S27AE
MTEVTCSRCHQTTGTLMQYKTCQGVPEGWEGSPDEPICPNCEMVGWVPHCISLVDQDLERVDLDSIPRSEWSETGVFYCEYIDYSVSWVDNDKDWPEHWQCPRCGGTAFEGVHPDYPPGGIFPGQFQVDDK